MQPTWGTVIAQRISARISMAFAQIVAGYAQAANASPLDAC